VLEVLKPSSPKPLLIAMGADERYAFPLSVTMTSVCKNAASPVRFVILADRLSENAKARIQRVARHWKAECSIRDVDSSEFPYDCGLVHLSTTTFTRLMLPKLLIEESRCVWIDCDMLVNRDVSPLESVDLGDFAIGAVRDQSRPTLQSHGAIPYATAWRGWDQDVPFFNGGFLIFDLNKWRRLEIDSRVSRFLSEYGNQLNAADQDVLNAVCLNAWRPMPFYWNVQGDRLRKGDAGATTWNPKELSWIEKLKHGEPTIEHFIGEYKPWNSGLLNGSYAGWMDYASSTPYYSPIEFGAWKARRICSAIFDAIRSRMRKQMITF
jgi:lipopolysaccharide biosynthesis glycosyltransferase